MRNSAWLIAAAMTVTGSAKAGEPTYHMNVAIYEGVTKGAAGKTTRKLLLKTEQTVQKDKSVQYFFGREVDGTDHGRFDEGYTAKITLRKRVEDKVLIDYQPTLTEQSISNGQSFLTSTSPGASVLGKLGETIKFGELGEFSKNFKSEKDGKSTCWIVEVKVSPLESK